MDFEKLKDWGRLALDYAFEYVPSIIAAGLILWIGFKIARKLVKWVGFLLEKAGVSETLRPFLSSVANVVFKGAVFLIVAKVIGADLTGLFAILAAAAFAVGMALQGSLGNFASGILILTLQPYKVGDWIQVEDKFGRVVEIGIFSTDVLTPGNKILIIPNSKVTDSVVTNFSEKGVIRLELEVTMPYEESFPRVMKIIEEALKTVPKILPEPKAEIGIQVFDSHNIQVVARPYCVPDDYWEVTFSANKAIKKAFSDNNVKVAYSEGVEIGQIGE